MAVLVGGETLEMRVACFDTVAIQTGINVLHYTVSSVAGTPNTADAAQGLGAIIAPLYRALIGPLTDFRGVGCKVLTPSPSSEDVWVSGLPGTLPAGDPLPTQTAGLIKKQTALPGRAFRGRLYLPFPMEANSTSQAQPDAAYTAGALALAVQLASTQVIGSGPNTANINPVLYHPVTATTTPITFMIVRGRWATQRRRGAFGNHEFPPF